MDTNSMLSRRCVLGIGAGLVGVGLAGCTGGRGPSGPRPTQTAAGSVRDVGFEGPNLVVGLAEDTDVSRLNLIAPDGSLFGSADVEVGVTTARIELLDIKPERAGMKHYPPGQYELVAVGESGTSSMDVVLEPALEIVDVRQYREGSGASDYGKLVVTVENVGTGPTWVYSVTYQNSPNFAANGVLGGDAGILSLEGVSEPTESILVPSQRKSFIGVNAPLLLPQGPESSCDGIVEMRLFVESPVLPPIETEIRSDLGGEMEPLGFTDEYSCTSVAIERN